MLSVFKAVKISLIKIPANALVGHSIPWNNNNPIIKIQNLNNSYSQDWGGVGFFPVFLCTN